MIACQYIGLNGGTQGNHFIGIDFVVYFLLEKCRYRVAHQWHAGRTSHHDHAIDLFQTDLGILERMLATADGAIHQWLNERFKLSTGQLTNNVFNHSIVLLGAAECLFGFFSLEAQRLTQFFIGGGGGAVQLILSDPVVNDGPVKIIATQVGIAIGGQYFKNTILNAQDGNVKRTTAQIVYGNGMAFALIEANAIGQTCRSRLVDNAQHVQSGQFACIAGSLALGIIEVGRNGDDCLAHNLIEFFFDPVFEGLEYLGRQLGGRVIFVFHPDFDQTFGIVVDDAVPKILLHVCYIVVRFAHQALYRIDGIFRIGNQFFFCSIPNNDFSFGVEMYH